MLSVKNNKLNALTLKDCLLYAGLLALILRFTLRSTEIYGFAGALDYPLYTAGRLLLFGAIFLDVINRYSLKRLIVAGAAGLLALISVSLSKNQTVFITALTCIAMYGSDTDRTIGFIYKAQKYLFILYIAVSVIFAFSDASMLVTHISDHNRPLVTFGMTHPNTTALFVFNILAMWLWLKRDGVKLKDYIIYLGISAVTFALTVSKTAFIASLALIALYAMSRLTAFEKLIKWGAMYITPLTAAAIALSMYLYNIGSPLGQFINRALTGRISLGTRAAHAYDPTLLGQIIRSGQEITYIWGETQIVSTTFDCMYTALLYNLGYIWLIIIIAGLWYLAKNGDRRVHIFIITFALYAVTEVAPLNCFKLFPILLLATIGSGNAGKEPGFVKKLLGKLSSGKSNAR